MAKKELMCFDWRRRVLELEEYVQGLRALWETRLNNAISKEELTAINNVLNILRTVWGMIGASGEEDVADLYEYFTELEDYQNLLLTEGG